MIKLICDLCGKEIKDKDYVEQSILIHYKLEESLEMIICKRCWENEEK